MSERINIGHEARNGQFAQKAKETLVKHITDHDETNKYLIGHQEELEKAESASEVLGIYATLIPEGERSKYGRILATWFPKNRGSDTVRHLRAALEESPFPIPKKY